MSNDFLRPSVDAASARSGLNIDWMTNFLRYWKYWNSKISHLAEKCRWQDAHIHKNWQQSPLFEQYAPIFHSIRKWANSIDFNRAESIRSELFIRDTFANKRWGHTPACGGAGDGAHAAMLPPSHFTLSHTISVHFGATRKWHSDTKRNGRVSSHTHSASTHTKTHERNSSSSTRRAKKLRSLECICTWQFSIYVNAYAIFGAY